MKFYYGTLFVILKSLPWGRNGIIKYTIGPLKKPDGSTTTRNEEFAEALACFFKSVFIHEDLQDLRDFPDAIANLVIT